ncbi:MAG: response regulator transcription factor [Dehalococcoidia bacterium]|nr:response regulator transcription factor [Dehalococcoidia bacterium]
MVKVRVLVADGESLLREGICSLLNKCDDIEIVGEAGDGKKAIEMVRDIIPDVVLLNISMPVVDGAEVIRHIQKESYSTRVLLLSQYEDRDRILEGLKAGASGYIPRRATASDLISAILTVHRGSYYLHPSVARTMVDDYLELIRHPGRCDPFERLTDKEKEVLRMIGEGRKGVEIARNLGMAPNTVLVHRTKIMKKLGVHNRTELIKYTIRKHLVDVNK